MKRLKKALRLIGLVLLIMMACVGIGFAGGVPLPVYRKKENTIELRIEQKDTEENKADTVWFNELR